MRIEDALVHGLALVAVFVLFVGLSQALDGRPPQTRPAVRSRGGFRSLLSRHAPVGERFIPIAGAFPIAGSGWSEPVTGHDSPFLPGPLLRIRPAITPAATAPAGAAATGAATMVLDEIALEDMVVLEEEPASPDVATVIEPPPTEPTAERDPLAHCLDLYEAGTPAEAAAVAARPDKLPAKRGRRRPPDRLLLDTMAGLAWMAAGDTSKAEMSLGAARLSLGGVDEARVRFDPREIASRVGGHLLNTATTSEGGPAREAALALASMWVDRGGPVDSADVSALERARGAHADAVETRIQGLCARGRLAAAHRVSAEPACAAIVPDARRAAVQRAWWKGVSDEVNRLIGEVLGRTGGGLRDGLSAIERVEALVAALPLDAVTAERRHELTRRLAWGYMTLGVERLDGGDPDGALEPLFRSLLLGASDAGGQAETRHALARAVDGLARRLEAASLERLRDGDFVGAMADSRRLSEAVDGALERGLSQEDLAEPLGRRQALLLQIAAGPAA